MPDLPDLTAIRTAVRSLSEAIADLRHQLGETAEVRRLTGSCIRVGITHRLSDGQCLMDSAAMRRRRRLAIRQGSHGGRTSAEACVPGHRNGS